ncbi:MAG: M4 family metallopeptidase [Saprospiraceae bacterium]|nr:M4 family metallopeptidase [Candidatus Defluviibacterium haderslevense]
MKKYYFFICLVLWIDQVGSSQAFKEPVQFSTNTVSFQLKNLTKGKKAVNDLVRASETNYRNNIFSIDQKKLSEAKSPVKIISIDAESGMPSQFETSLPFQIRTNDDKAAKYVSILKSSIGFEDQSPNGFQLIKNQMDELKTEHISLIQTWNGIPMHGAEYTMHVYQNQTVYCHGRGSAKGIRPIDIGISEDEAIELVSLFFKSRQIQIDQISTDQNDQAGEILKKELCFYFNVKCQKWELSYFFDIMPNQGHHWEIYVDALNGSIKESISRICTFSNANHSSCEDVSPCGSEIASANDLSSIPRVINTWKEGSLYYLIDASKPMFNVVASQMPAKPIGAIVTQNGNFKHPENLGFKSSEITSLNNSWLDKAAVSAHYHTGIVYDYYLNTHSRNSLNDDGGTIVSYVNISDQGGQPLEDAFWNCKAMYYGNGGTVLAALAKALDVCGHEITHGVIQYTAGLINKDESGAINESLADIFGVMIDRDDWKIGEDIVKSRGTPTGALRDLSNPNNGGSNSNQFYWQPKHMNEKVQNDTIDNGRIHTNSGIPSYAFYLFVQELKKNNRSEEEAKAIAEKIYYKTLKHYLSRSAKFTDLRIALERCVFDFYGTVPDVLASVRKAFDMVGIYNPIIPPKKDLPFNPGKEFVVYTNANQQGIYLYDFSGVPKQLSTTEIISKPSVTDDGSEIYFVTKNNTLNLLELDKLSGNYLEYVIDNQPMYRNAVISKDGSLLAVLSNKEEHIIRVYDYINNKWNEFDINQATSNTSNGTAQYADAMDFDHSGQYIIYDALNSITKSNIESEFWDINTIHVFDLSLNHFANGQIEKLFSKLEDNTSIGNPIFSKNNTSVIAFDYMKSTGIGSYHYLYAVNTALSDVGIISKIRSRACIPSFSIKDDQMLYNTDLDQEHQSLSVVALNDSKLTSNGSEKILLPNAKWGSWFAVGTRNLIVNKDIQNLSNLEISPNPFNSNVRIQVNSNQEQKIQIQVLNPLGALVFKQNIKLKEGLNSNWIDLSALHSGLYSIQLVNSKGQMSSKLFKY